MNLPFSSVRPAFSAHSPIVLNLSRETREPLPDKPRRTWASCGIIPFATKGTYYKKGLSIKFGKPYYVSSDLDKERDKFIEVIKDLAGIDRVIFGHL